MFKFDSRSTKCSPSTLLLVAVAATLATGCASKRGKGIDQESRFDFSVTKLDDGELDELEYDDDDDSNLVFNDTKAGVLRERTQARFAFGRSGGRGFFEVFTEEHTSVLGFEMDFVGLGGGMQGIPVVGQAGAVDFVVPYSWAVSLALSDDELAVAPADDASTAYIELLGSVGFGIHWYGLVPSVGIVFSRIGGATVFESGSSAEDVSFAGNNAGTFFDVRYKHPEFPIYVRYRSVSGDLESKNLTIGVDF